MKLNYLLSIMAPLLIFAAPLIILGLFAEDQINQTRQLRAHSDTAIETLTKRIARTEEMMGDITPAGAPSAAVYVPIKGARVQETTCYAYCRDNDNDGPYCAGQCKGSSEISVELSQDRALQLLIEASGWKYYEGTEKTITTPDRLVK